MGSIFARLSPPTFDPQRDMPDLSGKIILITGGNTGIGYETCKQLLLKNAKVYLAARSEEKANTAIRQLERETHKKAIFLHLDLGDLRSVRKAAESFLAEESKLDVLFNNAGVMISPPEQLTVQGHDLQFGTNVIGHFFLTELLMIDAIFKVPALRKSFEESDEPARVLHTSSRAHARAPGNGIDFVSITGSPERDTWVKEKGDFATRMALYSQSKIGNVFIANHFAKKYSDILVSCSLNPGAINTNLQRHAAGWMRMLTSLLFHPAQLGAYTQLWGATIAKPSEISGKYLVPWGKIGEPDKRVANANLEEQLVAYVQGQIKGF